MVNYNSEGYRVLSRFALSQSLFAVIPRFDCMSCAPATLESSMCTIMREQTVKYRLLRPQIFACGGGYAGLIKDPKCNTQKVAPSKKSYPL